jgi:hypothetical protein
MADDIVHRLRSLPSHYDPDINALCGYAAAEIERLRSENTRQQVIQPFMAEIEQQNIEIEQLRDQVTYERNACKIAADEIERLRKQCKGMFQSARNNGEDLLRYEAEIERLRAECGIKYRQGYDNALAEAQWETNKPSP